jgi:hypothetical protein
MKSQGFFYIHLKPQITVSVTKTGTNGKSLTLENHD